MKRNSNFVEGEFYHLYNRGNSKQKIFLDDSDRDHFLKLMFLHNSNKRINFRDDVVRKKISAWDYDRGDPIMSIGVWVLMPNHFHILATIPLNPNPMSDIGQIDQITKQTKKLNAISFFMKKMFTSYSKYFNTKYCRSGGLFEANFKSIIADSDQYLKYLFSYIHLNPIKLIDPKWKDDGIKDIQSAKIFLNSYKWSSYKDYADVGIRQEKEILSPEHFPQYFQNQQIFENEIFDWLSFNPEVVL